MMATKEKPIERLARVMEELFRELEHWLPSDQTDQPTSAFRPKPKRRHPILRRVK